MLGASPSTGLACMPQRTAQRGPGVGLPLGVAGLAFCASSVQKLPCVQTGWNTCGQQCGRASKLPHPDAARQPCCSCRASAQASRWIPHR